MARLRIALLLALQLAGGAAGVRAGAAAFDATLEIRYTAFPPLFFTGSGSGTSSASGVTLPSGVVSGTQAVPGFYQGITQAFVEIEGNGAGSFLGSPLGGQMPVAGSLRLKGNLAGGGPITWIGVPLLSTNLFGAPQVSVTLGILTLQFVPEPATLLLLGAGVAALAARGRVAARRAR